MAARTLTPAGIKNLKPTDVRREIPDAKSPGLRVVIQPSGAKSWAMRFRRPVTGKHCKLTLGSVDLTEDKDITSEPVFGSALTLAAARELASRIERERARGEDVYTKYTNARARELEEARNAAANTFGGAVVEFVREHRVRRWGTLPRRWKEDAVVLGLRWPRDCVDPNKAEPETARRGLAARWREKPLDQISSKDIRSIVDEARRSGIPGIARRNTDRSENRARRLRAALSNFFRWCVDQEKIEVSPVRGKAPKAPLSRERNLTDAEIRSFWDATEKQPQPVRALLRVLLLTGQRLNEVRGMRREELMAIAGAEGIWAIPAARTKNHRAHLLVLPPLVREIIAGVPVVEGSAFAFTGATGKTPVTIGYKVKQAIDEAMGKDTPPWRIHDLRRTCASGMLRLGIRSEAVERLLNHVSGTFAGVAGIYQRDPLTDEVAGALLRWSQHVAGLIEGGDNVVPMRVKQ
ncbi:integrase family protein [Bradyrhizobium sp. NBAIM16]|uniref:tyrosine-type recombinase/integrase n=1 Tax=Bradyrhizobium sp. NBAIM16 TaxID=2793813 RepID=UPI001CD3C441|nr:integrase family protein [Bradyrhizobium sp. NBAIM16]MCA1431182.1 integrase family protein [Bradyrhizobium sp. NBAIM16]